MDQRHGQMVALVTGSTSGIGLEVAKSLARDGWLVALHGLGTPAEVAAARDEVDTCSNAPVRHFPADMQDPAQVHQLVHDVEDVHGRLDLLVNNAGIQHIDRVENFPRDKWEQVLAVNLSAVFHATQAALPGMQARGFGRIVNIASVHGLVASTEKAAYVAAKHGVVGLTKVTALENARVDITCNAICPGWVRTPLVEKQIDLRIQRTGTSSEEVIRSMLSEKEPTLRFTTTTQIADTVRFLVSPAAANMTGISLAMDGGWSAQ